MSSNYQIGTTLAGLVSLDELTIPVSDPYGRHFLTSGAVKKASGLVVPQGLPYITWTWGFLSNSMRSQLRDFCPDLSAEIFIRSRVIDFEDVFWKFSGVLEWPTEEDPDHSSYRKVNFQLRFSHLVTEDQEGHYLT